MADLNHVLCGRVWGAKGFRRVYLWRVVDIQGLPGCRREGFMKGYFHVFAGIGFKRRQSVTVFMEGGCSLSDLEPRKPNMASLRNIP